MKGLPKSRILGKRFRILFFLKEPCTLYLREFFFYYSDAVDDKVVMLLVWEFTSDR